MRSKGDIVIWARQAADVLEQGMTWTTSEYGGGYWTADNAADITLIVARATAAMELLRQYAGAESFWTRRATALFDSKGDNQSTESGARAVGTLLRAWADQVEDGITDLVGTHSMAEVAGASTDVMGVVRRLLEDPAAHPAPPIVMCGAALEIALRAVADSHHLEPGERPSLSSLAAALRQAGVLTKQDVKDLEVCGGLRNAAAHGDFKLLTLERAGLMEQMTSLLLRRLAELV